MSSRSDRAVAPPSRTFQSSTPAPPSSSPLQRPFKKLPQELYDLMLDHIWHEDRTLAACSLTCRAWLPTTRVHLFYYLKLSTVQECTRFADLLRSSCPTLPNIAHFVRVLDIDTPRGDNHVDNDNEQRTLMCTKLTELLPSLRRVENLQLSWRGSEETLPETLRLAFIASLPDVKKLSLADVTFQQPSDMLEFLTAFPRLFRLFTSKLRVNTDTAPDNAALPAVDGHHQLIRDLTLHCDGTMTGLATLAFAAPSLRLLKLTSWTSFNVPAGPIAAILRNTSSELKHLSLLWTESPPTSASTPGAPTRDLAAISSLTHLDKLTLDIEVYDSRAGASPPPPSQLSLVHEILTTVNSPLLRTLDISVQLRASLRSADFTRLNWKVVDEGLAQLCARMPELAVTLQLWKSPSYTPDEDVEDVVDALPKSRQYGRRIKVIGHGLRGMYFY